VRGPIKTALASIAAVWLAVGASSAQAPAAPQAAAPTTTGNATRGKDLYLSYSCYACHGYNAQTGNGQRLLPLRMNQQQFVLYIRTPRTPGMPGYSTKVLSDAQAADVFAYVLSLPKAPELKDVPLLSQLPQ
jgi:mono/diheme cytochrome c family protein